MSRRRTHGARLLARTSEPVLPADLPPVPQQPREPGEWPGRILAEVTAGGEFIPIPPPEPMFGPPLFGDPWKPSSPWVEVAPLFPPTRPRRGWPRKVGRRFVYE